MRDTLAIVGNGFDIAHHYATKYSDFVAHSNCPAFEKFKRLQEKYRITDGSPQMNWYDFENVINALTLKWFETLNEAEREENDKERSDILRDIRKMNRNFDCIAEYLKIYISDATSINNGLILPTINAIVDEETPVISFNYSKIVERYSHYVFYIHGSIDEDNIILGYPVREEPDAIEEEATLYLKDKLRHLLYFRRFIIANSISPQSSKGKKLLGYYKRQIKMLFDGKGDFDDIKEFPQIIQEYLSRCDSLDRTMLYGCNIEEIRKLLIIGHSLMADYDVLEDILDRASNLQEVVIFTYSGETQKELQKKKKFFQGRHLKIKTCLY